VTSSEGLIATCGSVAAFYREILRWDPRGVQKSFIYSTFEKLRASILLLVILDEVFLKFNQSKKHILQTMILYTVLHYYILLILINSFKEITQHKYQLFISCSDYRVKHLNSNSMS